ncbi:hypothetical protein EJ07DRAFT_133781 [Lizonia empirigonia]|nr:hypothetical protein EJ07DRAFT_133781 [Lizonia empirigonia]
MTESPTDTLKRARELKASALQNISILQPELATSLSARATPHTFEDTLIKTLRAEGKPWADITARLNERRVSNQEAPTWTEDAVYSHFILNASVTATPAKEVGFEPRDYAFLRSASNGRESSSKAGKKRVKDFHNATELSANVRKPVKKGEEEETVKIDEVIVEILMMAVAKVERNFWVFVADEVEREGGKYIEPKELEKVFHGI